MASTTWILWVTLMVQSDPEPMTGRRDVAVTIHSRDFLSDSECRANGVVLAESYKNDGKFKRFSIVCMQRTGLDPELLNEQDNTTQAAPSSFEPSQKVLQKAEPKK